VSDRVVITGLGLVTPLGTGVEKSWQGICAGKSGIGPITRFDTEGFAVKIAAEVQDFRAEEYVDAKAVRHLELFAQYAVAGAKMAMADAKFTVTAENAARIGVITGCGMGGLPTIEKYHKVCLERGPRRITPFFIPMVIPNMGAGQISVMLKLKGPNLSLSTACAAGTHAVGEAFHAIQRGDCDAVITGGSESVICPMAVGGFSSMKALSKRNDEPERASRPFDRDRDGFIIGEGGGIMLLESLEHAKARQAKIYAEVLGCGMTGDGHHMAAPPEDGEGAARCLRMVLQNSGLRPDDIDYINAHGTSTNLNDLGETRAIKTVFGGHAAKIAVSSTKSMTGHLLGGAGGIEAVLTALSIYHQIAPPTMNLDNPDPQCDLDYVPNKARHMEIRVALSNSFGFGGTNAVLAMRRYEE